MSPPRRGLLTQPRHPPPSQLERVPCPTLSVCLSLSCLCPAFTLLCFSPKNFPLTDTLHVALLVQVFLCPHWTVSLCVRCKPRLGTVLGLSRRCLGGGAGGTGRRGAGWLDGRTDGQADRWIGINMDISQYIVAHVSLPLSASKFSCVPTITKKEEWAGLRRVLNCNDILECSQQPSEEGSIKIMRT